MDETLDSGRTAGNNPLICLYNFSCLEDKYDKEEASLDYILKDLIEILPGAMRYPEHACFKVIISPVAFLSPEYEETPWRHLQSITAFSEAVGSFEACYRVDLRGEGGEGDGGTAFSEEELMLFDYIARRLSRIIERLRLRRQLALENRSLQDANTALNEVLRRIRSEQSEVGAAIQANVNKVLSPLLRNLGGHLGAEHMKVLGVLERNLADITSPYTATLSSRFMALTPQEILVCQMIKSGLSSKDIALSLGLSVPTVNTHRENIRRKLSLNNKKVNLKTYLANNFEDSAARPAGGRGGGPPLA